MLDLWSWIIWEDYKMSIASGQGLTQTRLRRLQGSIPSTYTVFQSGATWYGEANIPGGTDYSGADAATVIMQAVAAAPIDGSVVVKGDATINSAVTLTKKIRYIHDGLATINYAGPYIQLGTTATQIIDYYVHLKGVTGQNRTAGRIGVKFVNGARGELHFNTVEQCDKGLLFDTTGATGSETASPGSGENKVYGGAILDNNYGVDFSTSAVWAEGNVLNVSIFGSITAGIRWQTGGASKFTTFIGVSDNVVGGGTDIEDAVGSHLILSYYLRDSSGTVHPNSFIVNMQQMFGCIQEWKGGRTFFRALNTSYLTSNAYVHWPTGEWYRYNIAKPAALITVNAEPGVTPLTIQWAGAAANPITWVDIFNAVTTGPQTSIHLTVGDFDYTSAARSQHSSFPSLDYDDTAVEVGYSAFFLPAEYKGATLTVKLAFAMASATAGAVRWIIQYFCCADGEDIATAVTSIAENVTVPGTAGLLKVHTFSTTIPASAGDLVKVMVLREGNSGSDTATGDAYFLGLELAHNS